MRLSRLKIESRIKWVDLKKTFYDRFHKLAELIFQQVLLTGSVSYSCTSPGGNMNLRARCTCLRDPGQIMSIFQPGTDRVRQCLGSRRAFCNLYFVVINIDS